MKNKELKKINADIKAYKVNDSQSSFITYLKNPGLRFVINFRICRSLEGKKLLLPVYAIIRLRHRQLCMKYNIDVPSHSSFGGGLYIPHALAGGIVINANSTVGERVTLLSGVVIGGNHTGTPVIGNDVFIGANAVIIGNIKIGDSVTIGAGAIVTHDVPDNAVVIGSAAHVHRINNGQKTH